MKPILITGASNGYIVTHGDEVSIHVSLGNLLAEVSDIIQSDERKEGGCGRVTKAIKFVE